MSICRLAGSVGAITALVTTMSAANAAEPIGGSPDERRTVTFVLENDVFYDTDRHYTNGVRVSWAGSPDGAPQWARNLADWIPFFDARGDLRTLYTLGQNIYTPNDITLVSPPLDDRPYAGWSYGSVGLMKSGARKFDQVELSLGIVGPSAFAEDVQKFVHKVVDSNDPKGWHTQIGNEPALLIAFQRTWRDPAQTGDASRLRFDLAPRVGWTVGNVFTQALAGATLRFGRNLLNDFGPPRIQPSPPGSGFFGQQDGFGWYAFAGVEARAVAHNIFLDGNTVGRSRSVNSRPLVGDAQFGLVAAWQTWRVSYTHVMRTREFKGQSERENFGAFSVSKRF
jgi:lipid A 3-O-deacylase